VSYKTDMGLNNLRNKTKLNRKNIVKMVCLFLIISPVIISVISLQAYVLPVADSIPPLIMDYRTNKLCNLLPNLQGFQEAQYVNQSSSVNGPYSISTLYYIYLPTNSNLVSNPILARIDVTGYLGVEETTGEAVTLTRNIAGTFIATSSQASIAWTNEMFLLFGSTDLEKDVVVVTLTQESGAMTGLTQMAETIINYWQSLQTSISTAWKIPQWSAASLMVAASIAALFWIIGKNDASVSEFNGRAGLSFGVVGVALMGSASTPLGVAGVCYLVLGLLLGDLKRGVMDRRMSGVTFAIIALSACITSFAVRSVVMELTVVVAFFITTFLFFKPADKGQMRVPQPTKKIKSLLYLLRDSTVILLFVSLCIMVIYGVIKL